MRIDRRIDGAATALVLLDLQEEHRRDARVLVAGYDTILRDAARLLGAARAARLAVVHVAYARDFDRAPRRPFERADKAGRPLFSAASEMTAICPEVAPRPGEPVATKDAASAFAAPDFAGALGLRRTMILAGVWTEACVAATMRDAEAAGIETLLVKDACGSATPAMHRTAVLNLANRLHGGGILDTARAVAGIGGQAVPVWTLHGLIPLRYDAGNVDALYDAL